MKVLAINGSPKKEGNTFCALDIVAEELRNEEIEVEIVHIGNKNIRGCIACGKCREGNKKCVFDDEVNKIIEIAKTCDGFLLGSPVYYSGIAGTMKCFLDRFFQVAQANDAMLRHKVGASVAAVRRSGGIPTFNQLNIYLNYSEMVMPTSQYWNVIHGTAPKEVYQDLEGVQIMKTLGKNMAWTMKNIENNQGISRPDIDKKVYTNFIR